MSPIQEATVTLAGALLAAFVAGHLCHAFGAKSVPQSTSSTLIGALVWLVGGASGQALTFNKDFFYFVLLPPIVFEAGFSLDSPRFLRNLGMILWLAVVGTVLSAMCIASGLYFMARPLGMQGDDVFQYCWLFGILLSAVDPVATLSVLGSSKVVADERLLSIIFGEAILNDSVAVVLYKSAERIFLSSLGSLSNAVDLHTILHTGLKIAIDFSYVTLLSCLVGVAMGIVTFFSYRLSKAKFPEYEMGCIMLMSYLTFIFAENWGGSGILSLFLFGAILGHYNLRNMSRTSQSMAPLLLKVVAVMSETFIYVLFGVATARSLRHWRQIPLLFVGYTLALMLVGRALVIFPSCFCYNAASRARANRRRSVHREEAEAYASLHRLLRKELTHAALSPFARSMMHHHSPYTTVRTVTIQTPGEERASFISRQSASQLFERTGLLSPPCEESSTIRHPTSTAASFSPTVNYQAKVNVSPSSPHQASEDELNWGCQTVLWLAGLRGAIAFALALSLPPSKHPHTNEFLVTTTLAVVIVTTVIFGGMTDWAARRLGVMEDAMM